eukprot:TRINITY_DN61002_c0_g1_i1.p1 TRINITY_DN61002_c0_g1~~TRINITY_DN61002_c0_g1_i1.p1  ORF type:complete len:484 (-),score=26.29 TRINITY_DN61002_c0_g1_i1:954-2405(-)
MSLHPCRPDLADSAAALGRCNHVISALKQRERQLASQCMAVSDGIVSNIVADGMYVDDVPAVVVPPDYPRQLQSFRCLPSSAPWFGLEVADLPGWQPDSDGFDQPMHGGALVTFVHPSGPAFLCGIHIGDVIVSVRAGSRLDRSCHHSCVPLPPDLRISCADDLASTLRGLDVQPGDAVRLVVAARAVRVGPNARRSQPGTLALAGSRVSAEGPLPPSVERTSSPTQHRTGIGGRVGLADHEQARLRRRALDTPVPRALLRAAPTLALSTRAGAATSLHNISPNPVPYSLRRPDTDAVITQEAVDCAYGRVTTPPLNGSSGMRGHLGLPRRASSLPRKYSRTVLGRSDDELRHSGHVVVMEADLVVQSLADRDQADGAAHAARVAAAQTAHLRTGGLAPAVPRKVGRIGRTADAGKVPSGYPAIPYCEAHRRFGPDAAPRVRPCAKCKRSFVTPGRTSGAKQYIVCDVCVAKFRVCHFCCSSL